MEQPDSKSKEIWVNEFTEKSAQRFRDKVMVVAEEDPNKIISIIYPFAYNNWQGIIEGIDC